MSLYTEAEIRESLQKLYNGTGAQSAIDAMREIMETCYSDGFSDAQGEELGLTPLRSRE